MRKLVLQMQMSVDGFVGAEDEHDWQIWGWGSDCPWDPELKQDFNAHFSAIDTILLSSRMAEEGYLDHWGRAAARYPAEPFLAFARRIIELPKVVPSSRLTSSRWDRTQVRPGDLAQVVTALKAEPGGPIGVFGGAGFASALTALGLVDEFQLYINPAILGGGTRIFDARGSRRLELLGSKAYESGMVVSRYAPEG